MRAIRLTIVALASIAMIAGQTVDDPQRALQQAMEWLQAGRTGDARGLLEKLESAHPGNGEVLYRLGVLDLRDGDLDAASRRLERAAEVMPGTPLPWLAVARVRLETGRRDEALEAAQKADELAPHHPAVGRALAMFYAQALEAKQRFAAEMEEVFGDVDVLLCPTIGVKVPGASPNWGDPIAGAALTRFTMPFDLSGHPTLSLPCGFSGDGMPISLQLVARHLEEGLLCRAGRAFERETEWSSRHPPV